MLGVQAALAVQVEVAGRLRQRQAGALEHLLDSRLPGGCHGSGVGADASGGQALLDLVAAQQVKGEAPHFVDAGEHALAALLGAVTQTLDPFAGAAQVVGDFLEALGGDGGDARVAGGAQRAQGVEVPGVEQEQLGGGHCVVAVGLLDQQGVAERALVAAEGQLVGVAAVGQQLGGVLVPVARLAEEVEADVEQRHFLFQCRGVAAPFAQALSADHRVVGQAQQVFAQVVLWVQLVAVRHDQPPHMWPTSSGSS
ncbi:hypothetical protein D3C81_1507310 [compost metagenome]